MKMVDIFITLLRERGVWKRSSGLNQCCGAKKRIKNGGGVFIKSIKGAYLI